MISLLAIVGAYVAAVFLGSRYERVGPGVRYVLVLLAVIQVLLVLVSMFTMDPPVIKRWGG